MSPSTWMTTSADTLIDLAKDSSLLSGLLDIQDHIAAFRSLGFEDALDVLEAMAGAPSPEVETELKDIGLDPEDLRRLGKRFLGLLGAQDAEDFQFLLTSFAMLQVVDPGMPAERIWPLFDDAASEELMAGDGIKLKLDAAAGLSLVLQALAELPKGVARDAVKPSILRLGLNGALSVGAGVEVSRVAATIGVSARAAGSASIDFYYRHVASRRIGEALLVDLGRLSSPFSVADLRDRLHKDNLSAIKIKANHEASISGRVGLVQDFKASGLVSGSVGADFGFTKSVSGEFDYLIHAASDGNLAVNIRRLKADKDEQTASFGLSVDMTEWAKKVYPQIQERLGDLGTALEDIEDFIPGAGEFTEAMGEELTAALEGFSFKEQLLQGLGIVEGGSLGGSLQQALLGKVESWPRVWDGGVSERAAELKASLLNRLPVATDVRNDLDKRLDKGLKKGFEKLDKALEARLKKLVTGASYQSFVEKLNKLGFGISDSIKLINDRVEAVTGPAKEALGMLQKRLTELRALFNDASQAKVSMAISALSREENSDALDLSVVLDPNHQDAQAVLNELVTADLDKAIRRIVDPEGKVSIPAQGAIVAASGTFTRYAAMLDERGFAFVLFGNGLSGKTSISADAKLVVDAHGNIQVLTKAEYKKQYKSFDDERELQIIDTIELATARQMQSLSLAVNLSMTDEDLSPTEAWDFLFSAENAGLLPTGTANKATTHLTPDKLKSGRLDVGMTLTRAQVLHLLAIRDPELELEDQPAIDAERVFRLARENIAEICVQQPPSTDLMDNLALLREELPGYGVAVGATLEDMIEGMTRKQLKDSEKWLDAIHGGQADEELNSGRALSWVRARYVAVNGCHGACSEGTRPAGTNAPFLNPEPGVGDTQNEQSGLLDALQQMREVFYAQHLLSPGGVATLRDMQREIGEAFKTWFVWQADFPRWWMFNTKEIRPLTLAFFKTLGELAQVPGATRPLWLSAALTLKDSKGEDKKRIALT